MAKVDSTEDEILKASSVIKDEIKEECEDNIIKRQDKRYTKVEYTNSNNTQKENEDFEKMLRWRKGIGHLQGSSLKFRKSAKGVLEVITPDSDDDDDVDIEDDLDPGEKKSRKRKSIMKNIDAQIENIEPPHDGVKKKSKKKSIDDESVLKCETCGSFGLITEFRSSGRFCSQRCVGAYASRKRAEMIAEQFAKGERQIPKTGRKSGKKTSKHQLSGFDRKLSFIETKENKENVEKDDSYIYYSTVGFRKPFCWSEYLEITNTKAVSLNTFLKEYAEQDCFPKNEFRQTMKLECVDPKHQSIICVVSIVEIQGARMRLHFDGWSECYDFWINSDSYFLHPCGWCQKNGQKLTPPRGMDSETFCWKDYLLLTGSEAAPESCFRKLPSPTHGFQINMKLEAIDRKNPDLVCVASVNNVIAEHFLVHFDEWDDSYDYWCRDDSPYIHSVGWCEKNGVTLIPPTDEMINKFKWDDYLEQTKTIAAPSELFKLRKEPVFEVGQKLEVVDPRNPTLIRVATVSECEEYRIKIHFDGWSSIYDYWFDTDSADLHPINWCKNTGHILEPPRSGYESDILCKTIGCRGIGHIKGAKYTTHHTSFGCPYTIQNLNKSASPVIDRLAPNASIEESSILNRIHSKKLDSLPDSTTSSHKHPISRPVGRPNKVSPTTSKITKSKTFKSKKRRGSDEVSSSTPCLNDTPLSQASSLSKTPTFNQTSDINHTHDTSYSSTFSIKPHTKPISSTHIPAGHPHILTNQCRSSALTWSQEDVAHFLNKLGFQDLVKPFKENEIDGQALLLLSQADMVRHLKLKLGPALKIYSEISKL
ncbi:lethal(3)malignant brain tumor-like protein 3 isoform X1 [Hydra vulgaris]|uniref:lethal(3)malignant brain tumor-like protein 3 isoform X1 n=2 Tax=Hydra vulgaris TaxID=6087 RepID=UPI001F5E71B0|nr:lethal(3)malignant brain tumor-like protein 3 isoform X1 [Hydra vulgaris]XP_047130688.1 lethal(3)malignant brain tumor-like protein 3 isoform X1 [Hydra vulgaris]XP_047130689.1 lethal(3)malignant brain tumor-like protein 3 isoform X1 [Hydra vulgaris]XP_047130690.1 lethal(3)malignant brain tumor-like protein 3 isoform X1 [Hydra vulgaris]